MERQEHKLMPYGFCVVGNETGSVDGRDHRWVVLVSVLVRRVIGLFRKPLELVGVVVEFWLNLVSNNGGLLRLVLNLFRGEVEIPQKGSETFISCIGQLDGRVDLYRGDFTSGFNDQTTNSISALVFKSKAMMDLCVMASKLAYENANVVRAVTTDRWKMHFVGFYNCWNEYENERSTEVFILCDRSEDANLILVSFRGTEPFNSANWVTDWDYSWYEIPELGKVHMGFLEALGLGRRNEPSSFTVNLRRNCDLATPADNVTAYYKVRGELQHLLNKHQKAKFVVTGHSLGGALASLFPALLLYHKEDKLISRLLGVCTFGQPRVGDGQLKRFMEHHLCRPTTRYLRVVYSNDVVPRLPYDDRIFLYKHFGLCLYFNCFYEEKDVMEVPNRNFFQINHFLRSHLIAVWELIRGILIGFTRGPEYREGWFSICFRLVGLLFPGVSAHSPRDYVNCVRLGSRLIRMTSL